MNNAQQLLDEKILLQSIRRLAHILQEENTHLQKLEINIVSKFTEEKIALILYMSQVQSLLQKHPELKQSLSPSKLLQIKESYLALDEAMAQNFALISYGRAANRRIIESFKKAYKKQSSAVTYTKNRTKKEEVVALSVSQQI